MMMQSNPNDFLDGMSTGHHQPDDSYILASTVLLLRDGAQGIETLMMRRPPHGTFADAWVWPGGVVESVDYSQAEASDAFGLRLAARAAGTRELREETGLICERDRLNAVAIWTPPQDVRPRFRTWFHVTTKYSGVAQPSPDEVAELAWVRPAEMLAAHAREELELVVPTWVMLWKLAQFDDVEAYFLDLVGKPFDVFETAYRADEDLYYWFGDHYWHEDNPGETGERRGEHRLYTAQRPWRYIRNLA